MTDGQGDRLRVLVVAASPALRAGLLSLLASDRQLDPIVAEGVEFGDAGSAPSAIVVDYTAGEPEEILSLAEAFPGTALVMIGADPATDGPGLSGAPVAYLPSDVDAAALAAAVRAAATGLIVLDPTVAGATGIHTHARTGENAEALTARESEVLLLVAEGLPNKAIARELGISEHTAKFHVGSLLGKLGAASRTEAVTLATRRGILPV
ncbi:MAG TPA: response regulator transcription factor [Thermomicrobiales bacterium]|nr:response regulator transcription factor [Thermomicrobiales bacterium]